MVIRKAVIPAAGLGTRFLPATKAIPKEMLPIVDKPMIQYVVEEAVGSGLDNILFVVGQGKESIADHFDYDFELDQTLAEKKKVDLSRVVSRIAELITVSTVRQKKPLGLGHAVLVAAPFVGDEPFGVFLGDDIIEADYPAMRQMMDVYTDHPGAVLAVQEVPWDVVSRYGIVDAEAVEGPDGSRLYRVKDVVEKPERTKAPSNLAIIGRYILPPAIFGCLETTSPGAMGEIQLTDGVRALIHSGNSVWAYRFQGTRYDAGDKLEFLMATVTMALAREDLGRPFRDFLKSLRL